MLSNSWLYHYYSVQSKIQMGLTYEGSRLPQITNNYYPYQPINPQHYQMHQIQPYDLQGHSVHGHHYDYSPPVSNLNHHNDINHNSPTMKETTLAPVDYSQQHSTLDKVSPAHHENGNREKIDDYCEPSRKKQADDKNNKLQNHDKKLSKVDFKSVRISNKKYTFKRIESLHISDSNPETEEIVPPRAIAYDNHSEHIVMETEHRDGQMLYLNSSIHSTRSRISKNFSSSLPTLPHNIEPSPGEIDQWNPSPTWSDNNIQKVPDIMHQQLSPYLITTPPTPMSASYIPHGSTFTFDWAPEHYVPTVATMHDERNIMELAPATRCYYNRPMTMMSIDDNNSHKDETTIRNSWNHLNKFFHTFQCKNDCWIIQKRFKGVLLKSQTVKDWFGERLWNSTWKEREC